MMMMMIIVIIIRSSSQIIFPFAVELSLCTPCCNKFCTVEMVCSFGMVCIQIKLTRQLIILF